MSADHRLSQAYQQDTATQSCRLCAGPKDFASVDRVVPGGRSYDYSNIHYRCMACPPTINALTANGDADDDDAVIDYVNGLSLK